MTSIGPNHFWIALQFLTRLPTPKGEPAQPSELAGSVLWFPAVGVVIGSLLWVTDALLGATEPMVRSAVILTVWVLLTGALHLDGLADTTDAWVGGHGDRERMLAIMKDPYLGPMGAAAVFLVLIAKFAALTALPGGAMLLLASVAARTLIVALFLTTPYVRSGGLGESMASGLPESNARYVLIGAAALALLLFGAAGIVAVVVGAAWLLLFRARIMARVGGTTGDTTGAMVEIGEALILIALTLG